jgi:hypothetical protein
MVGMRIAIGATMATAAGLLAANMLGVAAAEAPTGTPLRSVSVQGTATVSIPQGANVAVANATYRQAMGAAVSDGQNKAEFLTSRTGTALGGVQSIAEGGGFISCGNSPGGEYLEYTGEQPDFGSSPTVASPLQARGVAAPTTAPRPKVKAKPKKRKTPAAKKATASGCTLSAQVALVYTIG